ncbi:hypothetical protein ON010_g8298 [Phytophthora cinnamomi]|nr:hypothetical protein ON010_g8298 [Phytophthora cinnamomi]
MLGIAVFCHEQFQADGKSTKSILRLASRRKSSRKTSVSPWIAEMESERRKSARGDRRARVTASSGGNGASDATPFSHSPPKILWKEQTKFSHNAVMPAESVAPSVSLIHGAPWPGMTHTQCNIAANGRAPDSARAAALCSRGPSHISTNKNSSC